MGHCVLKRIKEVVHSPKSLSSAKANSGLATIVSFQFFIVFQVFQMKYSEILIYILDGSIGDDHIFPYLLQGYVLLEQGRCMTPC